MERWAIIPDGDRCPWCPAGLVAQRGKIASLYETNVRTAETEAVGFAWRRYLNNCPAGWTFAGRDAILPLKSEQGRFRPAAETQRAE